MKDSPGRPEKSHEPDGRWSDVEHAGADLTWGVGAVASRLGVAASTLRTWERRYGIGPSHRTHGGHRRYTERDISRVELVRRMVSRGVAAQDAARVAKNLDRDDLATALHEETASGAAFGAQDLVDSVLAAATTVDELRLREVMTGLIDGEGVVEAWRDLLSPVLVRLAQEVARGGIGADAQVLVTDVVLESLRRVRGRGVGGGTGLRPQVLLATFCDEADALPLVAWAAGLSEADVVLRLVGPDVDVREVLDLATQLAPSVVVVWDPPAESEPLLRRHLEGGSPGAFLRAWPAWPHELAIRFGAEEPLVGADVGVALRHVLDRVR